MSQLKTTFRIRFFEAASLLAIALTAIWFAGLIAYAEARRHGLI